MVLHKKMKFSIKDFLSKYDQIHSKLRTWSHLLNRSLMGNFFFVQLVHFDRHLKGLSLPKTK